MAHTVILAAGHGSRMRSRVPKCLLPVDGQAGTLDLILRWCAPDATVVFGAPGIAEHVRRAWPGVRLRHSRNPGSGMLGSLVVGTSGMAPRPLMVLLGDTVYLPALRERVHTWAGRRTAVAVQPGLGVPGREIPVEVANGRVSGLGDHCHPNFEMASAVLWAAQDWEVFRAGAVAGLTRQTEALNAAIRRGLRVDALEVPNGSAFDVDTPDDLERARRRLLTEPDLWTAQ